MRLFVARGQVLSLEQTVDPRLVRNLIRLVEIHCEIAPSPFDLAESQLCAKATRLPVAVSPVSPRRILPPSPILPFHRR